MVFAILFTLLIIICNGLSNSWTVFGIKTATGEDTITYDVIRLSLLLSDTMYSCIVRPTRENEWYLCNTSDTFKISTCNISNSIMNDEYALQIDNIEAGTLFSPDTNYDDLYIQQIIIQKSTFKVVYESNNTLLINPDKHILNDIDLHIRTNETLTLPMNITRIVKSAASMLCTAVFDCDEDIENLRTRTDSYGGAGGNLNDRFINQRISGISSWGIDENNYDKQFHSIAEFNVSSVNNKCYNMEIIYEVDKPINITFCEPFVLSDNEYIIGYRVIYKQWVHGLSLYTNTGDSYSCIAKNENQPKDYTDTMDIIYYDRYLSGIYIRYVGVIDEIAFQFTKICANETTITDDDEIISSDDNIIIEILTVNDDELGIILWNMDLSCDRNSHAYDVQISDNSEHKNVWIARKDVLLMPYIKFANYNDLSLTTPLSIRITRYYIHENESVTIYACNIIDKIEIGREFDFGTNFCRNDTVKYTIDNCHWESLVATNNFQWSRVHTIIVIVSLVLIVGIVLLWRKLHPSNEAKFDKVDTLDSIDMSPTSHIEPVTNALCLIITIGDYNHNQTDGDIAVTDELQDIPVDKDDNNLRKLFEKLNYDILPVQKRSNWTQKVLVSFLKEDVGKKLFDEQNDAKYDGLIVCISSHGIESHIITSDLKAMQKDAIHRILSLNFPKIRDIPRIFLFDSCDGSATRDVTNLDEDGKYFGLHNLPSDNLWSTTDKNPDFKLVKIYGANIGFQAKYNMETGSYLLYEFCQRMNENESIGVIFQRIQNDLHDRGKQQTENVFNNNTQNIKLKMNTVST